MASVLSAKMPNFCRSIFVQQSSVQKTLQRLLSVGTVDLAARKGTREKARSKKVKAEVKKFEFVPYKLRMQQKELANSNVDKHISDEDKPDLIPEYSVYPMSAFKTKKLTIIEAISNLKETHHPTMYNALDSPLFMTIELNMTGEKKTRVMDNFHRTALIPYGFQANEERKILVFTKDLELQKGAIDAGAMHAGGLELIKSIQTGEIKLVNFDYVLAHSPMLTDLIPLRGLMKRRFPSTRSGTLDNDIVGLVSKFLQGIQYKSKQDENQRNFGTIETQIGILNMDIKHLEANIIAFMNDVIVMRPKRGDPFLTKCYLKSDPSPEIFKIDPFLYFEASYPETVATPSTPTAVQEGEQEDSDSDDEKEKVKDTVSA